MVEIFATSTKNGNGLLSGNSRNNISLTEFRFCHFKDDVSEAGSAPRTPQDVTSISSMPLTVHMSTLETPPPGTVAIDEMVDHPLSPTQEQMSDTIV